MPFRFDEAITPNGLRYLIIEASGSCDIEDGRALEARLQPGQPYHRGYLLSRVAKGTEYSPEVRRFFPTLQGNYMALAAVVTSPIVRAAINLMVRFAGNDRDLKMFTNEAEALAWLENFDPKRAWAR
jgi:hypothetical protein